MLTRYKAVIITYAKTFFKDKALAVLLAAALIIGVVFAEYTIVFYRYLNFDYTLAVPSDEGQLLFFEDGMTQLYMSFLVAVGVVVLYAVRCVQKKNKSYYDTLNLLGYSRTFVSVMEGSLLSAIYLATAIVGSGIFYLLFFIFDITPYVGHFTFWDSCVVLLIGLAVIIVAELFFRLNRGRRYE